MMDGRNCRQSKLFCDHQDRRVYPVDMNKVWREFLNDVSQGSSHKKMIHCIFFPFSCRTGSKAKGNNGDSFDFIIFTFRVSNVVTLPWGKSYDRNAVLSSHQFLCERQNIHLPSSVGLGEETSSRNKNARVFFCH